MTSAYALDNALDVKHRTVIQFARIGWDAEQIADRFALDVNYVRDIMNHPPNQEAIQAVRTRLAFLKEQAADVAGVIILKGFDYYLGVMDDPKAPHYQKKDAIEFAADHDPLARVNKRTKVDSTHTHVIQTERQLNSLLENADKARKALERDRLRAIDVSARLLEESESGAGTGDA